jgi:hypothetical protein
MELYMTVAEGYRLTLDVNESANGDFGWFVYVAMSKEKGKGTLIASDLRCNSASEAGGAGMRALERFKREQAIAVFTPNTAIAC